MSSKDNDGDQNLSSDPTPDNNNNNNNYNNNNNNNNDSIPDSSEFIPPESFWLSKDSEFDWFDRNAFLERKESTRANSTTYSRSNSQKFSVNLKSKPAIIGLPKTQRNTYVDANRRQCKPANIRLFPKRSGSGNRPAAAEPSSPKISCIGRVRSKRCPNRRRSKAKLVAEPEKIQNPVQTPVQKVKPGFMSRITKLFRSDGNSRKKVKEPTENSYSRKNSVTVKPVNSEPASPPEPEAEPGPPGLGGMNRFVSGRRSVNWMDDVDVDVR